VLTNVPLQVGKDPGATRFLSSLDTDPSIGGMIDCTSYFEQVRDYCRPPLSRFSALLHSISNVLFTSPIISKPICYYRLGSGIHFLECSKISLVGGGGGGGGKYLSKQPKSESKFSSYPSVPVLIVFRLEHAL